MIRADLVVRDCAELLTCRGPLPKRGDALRDCGPVERGWIASRDGRIVFVGSEAEFKAGVAAESEAVWIDGRGMLALPGFVDAHTHLPFAGDRVAEFSLRLQGWTYTQLAEKGMGIKTTVAATRAASREELAGLCLGRLERMLLGGATTIEAKSGYGLNLGDEIKQLEVLAEVDRLQPVEIVPTFMGAHDVPAEYRDRPDAYVDFLIETMIPEVRKRRLAEFFDVFCERGAFSLDQTRRLVQAAREAGFGIKIHSDEFVPLGGTELAAEVGAVSAEHLIAITPAGIQALARSSTIALLLPGVPFFLRLDQRPPARELIEAGAAVVLASDFNPGSSMVSSMMFVLQLGVFTLGLSVEEAINACTANAACAVGRQADIGSLEPGKKMDVILCNVPSRAHLLYELGPNPVRHVVKNGRVAVRDGRRV
jgi:imidazolonepropionase